MDTNFDCSGWATKNDLKCADGRTIRDGAFKDNDGETVPLVWQHQHDSPANVLGHALLEYRQGEGMYAYAKFNDTPNGENAKKLVAHGDVTAFSIFANQLTQRAGDVIHGSIKEVSLVLAGANPGAFIDFPVLAHSGESVTDEAIIYTDEEISLAHSEETPKKEAEDKDEAEKKESDDSDKKQRTVSDVIGELTDEQKQAVGYLIGQMTEKASDEKSEKSDETVEHSDEGGENIMKFNVFDSSSQDKKTVLSHDDMKVIMADAKRCGSLRDAVSHNMEEGVLAHAVTDSNGNEVGYGIADIDYLFPDAKALNNTPEFIKREDGWVTEVMNGVHRSAFSRVKSTLANITMDEARAKGYMKGKLKKDEVFTLLKRSTDPQTIYKKQKLDRDDILDITDFDVVRWIKSEMRMMLDEEIVRAILIGDGRASSDDDKISEDHIRPIATDSELYTIKATVAAGTSDSPTEKNFIRAARKARKNYKGSGNPVLFTTEDMLTDMLLLEDNIGHLLYEDESHLARVLRVKKIVAVPPMEDYVNEKNGRLLGVIVNLNDYNVGADKGGDVSMFDDFDIDYNQQKYLIETRCSGALVKPFSAIALWTSDTAVSTEDGDNPSENG
jgi:HK97 family phage prohead protease